MPQAQQPPVVPVRVDKIEFIARDKGESLPDHLSGHRKKEEELVRWRRRAHCAAVGYSFTVAPIMRSSWQPTKGANTAWQFWI